jgi:hypothetical protein
MQASPSQTVTWANVALDALKILGPAAIALLASLLTLRHQRLLKRQELDTGARLRAREMVFDHYQKKLDRLEASAEGFARTLGEIEVLAQSPEAKGVETTAANFAGTLISIALTAKHEMEDAEEDLRSFGLLHRYGKELAMIKRVNDPAPELKPDDDPRKQLVPLREGLFALVLVQEALLQARMRELFHEYLPARSGGSIPTVNK